MPGSSLDRTLEAIRTLDASISSVQGGDAAARFCGADDGVDGPVGSYPAGLSTDPVRARR